MRVLWLSNAPWAPSGYGEQTGLFVPRLAALGHEMAIAANYGLHAAKFPLGDISVYPANEDWGNPTLATFVDDHNADLVIALCDSWVMKPKSWQGDFPVAIWAPLDHYPIPPAVLGVLKHDRVRPIAMSRFGESWMKNFKLDPLYVPHGVDTTIFKPQPEIRNLVRDEIEIPHDAFLVGMVAANKGNPMFPRKGFPQAFDAFAHFAKDRDDARLYVHSPARPRGGHGINLDSLWRALCVDTGCDMEKLRFPPDEFWHLGGSRRLVANLYAAFDVLLHPSWGEGFGIPIVEAQACGVPVITSNHSAMTELTEAGWCVEGDRYWDPLQEAWAIVPSIGAIQTALEDAYDQRTNKEMTKRAVEFAQEYDADRVTVDYWMPVLEQLAGPREVPPLKVSRQVRRAQERKKAKV